MGWGDGELVSVENALVAREGSVEEGGRAGSEDAAIKTGGVEEGGGEEGVCCGASVV